MITKKYEFSVGTCYVGSNVKEEVEIEFEDEDFEDEEVRDNIIEECFEDWVWENINSYWEEIEEDDE